MSYIKSLEIRGLKGVNASFDLGPINYISGPNGSHKTSIIDALQILLLGYHPKPGIERKPRGVMRFSSGSRMALSCHFSDGQIVARTFEGDTASASQSMIPKDFKADPLLLPCLDHSLYFGKTEGDRVEQVIGMAESAGADASVPAINAALKRVRVEGHTQRHEEAIATILAKLPDFDPDKTVQMWLADLLDELGVIYKNANAQQKNLDSTAKTLTQANAMDTVANPVDLDSLKAQLEKLAAAGQAQQKIVHDIGGRHDRNQHRAGQRQRLQAELDELRKQDASEVAVDSYAQKAAKLRKDAHELQSERERLNAKVNEATVKMARLDAERIRFEADVTKAENELKDIETAECCPTCKTKRQGWQNTLRKMLEEKRDSGRTEARRRIDYIAEERKTEIAARKLLAETREQIAKSEAEAIESDKMAQKISDVLGKLRTVTAKMAEMEEEPWTPEESTAANMKLTELRDEYRKLNEKITAAAALDAEHKRIAQVQLEYARARAELEIADKMKDVIKDEQRKIVDQAFGPVLAIANRLTAETIAAGLIYRDGLIGKMTGNVFTSVATFSGFEERLTFTAITAGLAANARHKIAVIDELGTFDAKHRKQIVLNCIELIKEKKIDQFFLCDVNAPQFGVDLKEWVKEISCR